MVKKGIRDGICHLINQYLKYQDVNNLFGRAISQKLTVGSFEQFKNTSELNKDFIKNYNKDTDEGYFFEVDVKYPKRLHKFHDDLLFLPGKMKVKKVENLVTNINKNNILYT